MSNTVAIDTTVEQANTYLNAKKSWNDVATMFGATYSENSTAVTCQELPIALFYRSITQANAKGVIILHHGLGYCSEMFAAVAHNFVSVNLDVYAFDTVGHGKSGSLFTAKSDKPDANVPQFAALVECALGFLAHVAKAKQVPLFLFGESMGAATVLEMIIHDAQGKCPLVKGILLEGPAVKCQFEASDFASMESSASIPISVTDDTQLQDQIAYRQSIKECVENVPLATIFMLLHMGDDIVANVQQINVPLIIIQGEADKVVKPQGAQLVFDKNQNANKQLHIIGNGYHLPSCDVGCIKVASLYRDFINALELE